uniref:HTH_48 domain-containing protein n=1 Tax=Glossina pallidipes TaxID=7398 RepID=A0A1A9ZD28_GLOPL
MSKENAIRFSLLRIKFKGFKTGMRTSSMVSSASGSPSEEETMKMRVDNHTDVRRIMLYYFEKGWKAARSFRDLNELFGKGTISGRSGRDRPSDFDDQSLLAAIERDESLVTQLLNANFNVDHSTIVPRLKMLKKWMVITLRVIKIIQQHSVTY